MICNRCKKNTSYIYLGESLCEDHKNNFSHFFTSLELKKISFIIKAKKFSILNKIKIDDSLKTKIEILFKDLI